MSKPETTAMDNRSAHRSALPFVETLAAVLVLSSCFNKTPQNSAIADEPAKPAAQVAQPKSNADRVLPPENYFGQAQAGYEAAKLNADVCAKLFCYCGCDMTDGHSALLDCFTSDHGVDCEICCTESILALQLKKQGKSLAEIQKAIDQKYEHEYPFDKPSKALLTYRAQRLYHPAARPGAKPKSPASTEAPKLKPGAKIGNCCHGKKSAT